MQCPIELLRMNRMSFASRNLLNSLILKFLIKYNYSIECLLLRER